MDLIGSALMVDSFSAQDVNLIRSCHSTGTIRIYQSSWTKFFSFIENGTF